MLKFTVIGIIGFFCHSFELSASRLSVYNQPIIVDQSQLSPSKIAMARSALLAIAAITPKKIDQVIPSIVHTSDEMRSNVVFIDSVMASCLANTKKSGRLKKQKIQKVLFAVLSEELNVSFSPQGESLTKQQDFWIRGQVMLPKVKKVRVRKIATTVEPVES